MTDEEKIADAAKNGWMKDHYRIYNTGNLDNVVYDVEIQTMLK